MAILAGFGALIRGQHDTSGLATAPLPTSSFSRPSFSPVLFLCLGKFLNVLFYFYYYFFYVMINFYVLFIILNNM